LLTAKEYRDSTYPTAYLMRLRVSAPSSAGNPLPITACGPVFSSEWIVRRQSTARANLSCWLDSNLVVYGGGNSLDTAEVALCRLDRNMAEKELNLLKFASGLPT
jgi:hypothetical protein